MSRPDSDRRGFLQLVVFSVAGVVGATIVGLSGGYLLGGAGRQKARRWTPVARVDTVDYEQPVRVEYSEIVPDAWTTIRRRKSVWLVNGDNSEVTAFDPHCTHLGCPYDWDAGERLFKCPCHNGVFDIRGHVVRGPPPRELDRREVRIDDGWVQVGNLIPGKSV